MRTRLGILYIVSVLLLGLLRSYAVFAEDWKGEPETSQISVGALTGMGVIDGSVGYALIATVSKKIISHGFISDLDNSVSIEGQLGPVFYSGLTPWHYSVHLRWDFEKDPNWTLYALGGAGGNIVSVNSATRFEFFPRFGVGAFWKMMPNVWWRGELSHELIAIGILLPF